MTQSKSTNTVIILLLILILFAVTTPTLQDHVFQLKREHFQQLSTTASERHPDRNENDHWLTKLTKEISKLDTTAREGMAAWELEQMLSEIDYRNYILCSLTWSDGELLSFGIFNQVLISEKTVRKNIEAYF